MKTFDPVVFLGRASTLIRSSLETTAPWASRWCSNGRVRQEQVQHHPLLGAFAQSSRRAERFVAGDWQDGCDSLPYLASAPAAVCCEVDQRIDYATHSLFIGRVIVVRLADDHLDPLFWFNGCGAAVSQRSESTPDSVTA